MKVTGVTDFKKNPFLVVAAQNTLESYKTEPAGAAID